MAHLEELWFVLQKERQEVEDMKKELFRERIEIGKLRLQMQQENDDDDDEDDIDHTEDTKDIKVQK